MGKDLAEGAENLAMGSFEYDDDGPYFDMDLTPSLSGIIRSISPVREEKDKRCSKEFEFSTSSISATSNKADDDASGPLDDVCPADDLFYNGHLLPLQFPPRLKLVRNLSMSKESEADRCVSPDSLTRHEELDFDSTFSSGSEDSNQMPTMSREVESSSVKSKNTQHSHKSAHKWKASLFGLRKSSKVSMDDRDSTRCSLSSPTKHHHKSSIKFKSLKTPIHIFAKHHNDKSENNPDHSSWKTGAKHVLQKYMKMVKHRISHRHHHHHHRGADHHLYDEEECGWSSVGDESGRRSHIPFSGGLKLGGFWHSGSKTCPPSISSSPHRSGVLINYYSDDLQSAIQGAIAHCKESNRSTDSHISKSSECP